MHFVSAVLASNKTQTRRRQMLRRVAVGSAVAQVSYNVVAPGKAWRILQGESPWITVTPYNLHYFRRITGTPYNLHYFRRSL